MEQKSEIHHGLRIDWDVAIGMDDGTVLRADVYRPVADGRYPVLLSNGPYGKGLSFQEGFSKQWEHLVSEHPEVTRGTSCDFANWETADPERWVPFGYVCVRVDSRGSGRSPGVIDPWAPRETADFSACIEWAGTQPWSNGNVGLAGVSYYAISQWAVAATRPAHLKAICPFEGAVDHYRDVVRHGGIMCTFLSRWLPMQVTNVQHGLGSRARTNPNTGSSIAGDVDLTDAELSANRADVHRNMLANTVENAHYRDRTPDIGRIEVPLLSCANWGGQGLHLRGNVEGYLGAGSPRKWLEIHGRAHWVEFYTDYGVGLQRQFFDHFLKGDDNGWDKRPPILLQVRHIDGFKEREEQEWPIARTSWTTFYLDAESMTLARKAPPGTGSTTFRAMQETVTFLSEPLEAETEMTGPMAARLFAASTTRDADLFLTVRLFDPDGREVMFHGALDPNSPLSVGWLRASQRKLDAAKSMPYRPYHTHDEHQPLEPGDTYELDIEIWPSSIVIPEGYRLGLTVGGHDFDHGLPEPLPKLYGIPQRGVSVFLHDDPADRPAAVFGGETTLLTGGDTPASILLPVIPEKQ